MLTRHFTLFDADIETVKDAIIKINNKWEDTLSTKYAPLEIDIDKTIPYYTPIDKIILWKPANGEGTVMFGNGSDGFNSLCYCLNADLQLELTLIALYLDSKNTEEQNPLYIHFIHYFPDGTRRWVRTMWDDRWDFYEDGKPMPFEQVEQYNQRLKRKRLTNDMVLDYVKALGWDMRDPAFFTSKEDACYIERIKVVDS